MPVKKSFKLHLIFSYILTIAISFGFIAIFLSRSLEDNSLQEIKSSLVSQAQLIQDQIPPGSLTTPNTVYLSDLVKRISSRIKCRLTIVDKQGKVLADSQKSPQELPSMENHLYRPEVRDALSGATGIDMHYSATLKIEMLYVALPILDNSGIQGVLRLALPLENVRNILFATRKIILLGLFFALVLAFILGSVMAGRITKPINKMIRVSRKFSEGDFSRRIIQDSRDEIGELAVTLNKMAQDIEDKIRQIETQNQKLTAILNSMIEGVIVVDKAGYIVSINHTIEKIFDVSEKDALGKLFLETVRNNDILEAITRVFKDGNSVSAQLDLIFPVRRIFQINAAPIFYNQTVSGCLVVIHDITEIRRLETMRRDFVANVSHELKTPLTSIKGFVETLLEGALEDKENNRDFLRIIHDHAERLNSLVNDLLSLSYLESKEIILDKNDLNLNQQLEEVIAGFMAQLKKRGIAIKNELPPGLTVKADIDRIKQVFINLIDNAIKFNKENGSIRVFSQELEGEIKICVEDSGMGIPAKDIPRIFERFYRVDKARSRSLGGTGLGLSIVKHIVELHGGRAGLESSEGLGSKFWFTLLK
ncbi:MAG: ATP-binding protein [Candidatus Omnitrophica bacterium]|jgi:two-component system phosphate regulon sensor histidine kinase PhoR|nr:cell wall metabolism sensor histidine kinase WalK [Candidatus Omnitrophota bacterium]MDD5079765.1 ATP-binding protein [Candidatus Omnitrophota bacterium]